MFTFAKTIRRISLALLTALSFVASSQHGAFAQDPSFAFSISGSEALLASNNDPVVAQLEAWDSPSERLIQRNTPFIELVNTSSTQALTEFRISIGDTAFNFGNSFLGDFATLGFSTPNVALSSTTAMGGDELVLTFGGGGLAAGETARFRIDIDRDDPSTGFLYPDFRTVLYDLFTDPTDASDDDNSMLLATFGVDPNAPTAAATLPDQPRGSTFVNSIRPYSVMDDVVLFSINGTVPNVIPEPGSLCLTVIGAAGLLRRRRGC